MTKVEKKKGGCHPLDMEVFFGEGGGWHHQSNPCFFLFPEL